jgi:DNA polymerase I
VRIVSSDKDLMQLVTTSRGALRHHEGQGDRRDEVIEKFGVPPEKVIEVQALAGDSVDNIPGVPGIGVKTGAQLIQEYGDLETLLAGRMRSSSPSAARSSSNSPIRPAFPARACHLEDDVPLDHQLDEFGVHRA